MACKGICDKHKVKRTAHGYYAEGIKRCSVCTVYIRWDGERCPCCNTHLRTKPRDTLKKKLAVETVVSFETAPEMEVILEEEQQTECGLPPQQHQQQQQRETLAATVS